MRNAMLALLLLAASCGGGSATDSAGRPATFTLRVESATSFMAITAIEFWTTTTHIYRGSIPTPGPIYGGESATWDVALPGEPELLDIRGVGHDTRNPGQHLVTNYAEGHFIQPGVFVDLELHEAGS